MSNAPFEPDPLDAAFSALKERTASPPEDLVARVIAEADAVQDAFMTPSPQPRATAMARFLDAIGGWPSLAGLATAGVAGVWIGFTQSATLVQGSQFLLYGDASAALVDLDPGFGLADLDGGL